VNLTEPYAKNNIDENDGENDGDNDGNENPSISAATSTGANAEAGTGSGLEQKYLGAKLKDWRNRDQWTRWPIPKKDVPPPDWSLQDEIEAIIKFVLFSNQESDTSSFDEGSNEFGDNENNNDDIGDEPSVNIGQEQSLADFDYEDQEDTYSHSLAEMMTPVIQNKFESLFSLISAHTIARSDSMQNRIEPFDWRDLINILGSPAAGHLVDGACVVPCSPLVRPWSLRLMTADIRTLQNITTRMEQIFETTPASASNVKPAPLPSSGQLAPVLFFLRSNTGIHSGSYLSTHPHTEQPHPSQKLTISTYWIFISTKPSPDRL